MGDVLPEIGKNYAAYNLTIYDAAYVALAEAMKLARIFPAPLVQAQGLGWSARPLSPFGPRLHVMAGVAHPSGVMLPVTSNGVVLVYPLPTSPTPRPALSRNRGDSGA